MKKFAVLTSGGDAPAMNACLRAIVRSGEVNDYKVYGIVGGYQGLIEGNFKPLSLEDVEGIISMAGTIIKTTRCDAFMTEEGFVRAVKNAKNQGFDAIIILGGDGSFKGALKLMKAGVNVVCIPCTIDNDLGYTDFTIGFDTAVSTVTTLLGNVRDTSSAHDRVCVVEVMGRHCGEIALNSGIASGAEVVLIPEISLSNEQICNKITSSTRNGEKCVLVVVAEGVGSAESVAEMIKQNLGIDAKSVDLGYVQRGGTPTANDRILATKMGVCAVECLTKKKYGMAISVNQNKINTLPLIKAIIPKSKLNKNLYFINDTLSI